MTKLIAPGRLQVTAWSIFETPWGTMLLCGNAAGIVSLDFPQHVDDRLAELGAARHDADSLGEALKQLDEYFLCRRKAFQLKLAMNGTLFQKAVWRSLQDIPYGTTISYGELASRVGKAKASRAVGTANGRNRIPIIIPCHRVIAAGGGLGGFGGGLTLKRELLGHEGICI